MEPRPLEHELDDQVVPRLTPVAGHEGELGEVVHHLVDALDELWAHRQAGAGHAGAHEDRDVELTARRVDRVVQRAVDRDLGRAAHREGADGLDVPLVLETADLAHLAHHVVGIDIGLRDEPVGMFGEGALALLALTPDQAVLDAEAVHLAEGDLDRVGVAAVELLRHVLEHVLDGELEVGRLAVLELVPDEVVDGEVLVGKPDHGVDHADSGWWSHGGDRNRIVDFGTKTSAA